MFTGERSPRKYFILAQILELTGGAILPAPAVPVSTMIITRLKCIQKHNSQFTREYVLVLVGTSFGRL